MSCADFVVMGKCGQRGGHSYFSSFASLTSAAGLTKYEAGGAISVQPRYEIDTIFDFWRPSRGERNLRGWPTMAKKDGNIRIQCSDQEDAL